jgi:arylsulfatase A-like enzyme/Tfp pilus assembly protein PilF
MKRCSLGRLAWWVAVVALLLGGCEKKPPAAKQSKGLAGYNVLVVTLDTTRADRLGCYGYTHGATPTLDGLAAKGTLFEHAYAQAPLTLPSHCSIFSGKYPREHGVRNNGREALSPDCETLATVFKRHGYRTGAFIGSFVLDPCFGLNQGFDTYDADMGVLPHDVDLMEVERRADAVTDRALKWLGSGGKGPFFGWIHYYDPHDPYDPPAPFRQTIADAYDGEIAFVDWQFKRVMDWLSGAGLTSKTLIVVVGDHGEAFGEHGEHSHAIFLYDTTLHVPMFFVQPDAIAAGKKVATNVELIDVFPTVLDLMGWPLPAELSSRSLTPAFGGELEPRDGYAESLYARDAFGWAEQRCVITPKWKYISSIRPELFDRQADPAENTNLAAAKPDEAKALLTRLREHHEAMKPGEAREVELSTAGRQALESLGYVSAGKRDEAEQFLTPGLPDPKDLPEVMTELKKARALLRAEKPAEAIPLLRRAAERSPRSRILHYNLGIGLLEAGQVDAAIAELDIALRIDPGYAEAMLAMGDAMMTKQQYDKAAEYYRAAVALKEHLPEGHARLGAALQNGGHVDEALAAYRKALTLAPGWEEVYGTIGVMLLGANRAAEAIPYLREAVRLRPDLGSTLNQLGIALAQAGQAAEAKASFLKATQMPDAAAEAYFSLGVTAGKEGNMAEATGYYERCLEVNPAYTKSAEALAALYLGQQRTADAIRVLRIATTASPNETLLVNTLAWLLATTPEDKLRDGAKAVELARRAVELTKQQNPTALRTLAAAYAEAGDFAQAVRTAQQALAIAQASQQNDLASALQAQLTLYQNGRAYHTEK